MNAQDPTLTAEQRKLHDDLARKLADEGRLIEAGFRAMCASTLTSGVTEDQLADLRMAYMAGAQHLFSSIVSILDSDREPTMNDLRRMDLINQELERFVAEMRFRVAPVGGSA